MSVSIIFESHATSVDNESGVASGHHDCELSGVGREQASELGLRYPTTEIATVYCSDLRRSWETAEIAFAGRPLRLVRDRRLRECDYGDRAGMPAPTIKKEAPSRVSVPFRGGESYLDTSRRMRSFLVDVAARHAGQSVMVIGHRATQYGLEHWLNGVELPEAVAAPWQWQPGWQYEILDEAILRADART